MWLGRTDDAGRLFVVSGTTPADSTVANGVLVGPVGPAIVDLANNPSVFNNGLPLTNEGRLCMEAGGAISHYALGLPFTAQNRLVCQTNLAPTPGDPYVNGIRVGPNGGIYITDLTPPAQFAWSGGFSNGYGL